MMKNEYAKASAEVVLFEAEEMVATACGDATNAYDDWVIKTARLTVVRAWARIDERRLYDQQNSL